MNDSDHAGFTLQTFHSVTEMGQTAWDALSAGRPFQSAAWYRFGERVMSDCEPVYIVLSRNGIPAARGTFWVVRNEPLPVPAFVRRLIAPLLRRRPLLICRSPLSSSSGLVLPEPPARAPALLQIATAAQKEMEQHNCSFLLFDYLDVQATPRDSWPAGYIPLKLSAPGTRMTVLWKDFDAYLAAGDTKGRQRYKRCMRQGGDCRQRGIGPAVGPEACQPAQPLAARHVREPRHGGGHLRGSQPA